MTEKDMINELKFLELSVEKLKLMALYRKRKEPYLYKRFHCTDSDVEQVCTAIRKSSLIIKQNADLVGKY